MTEEQAPEGTPDPPPIPTEKLVKAYIKMRDKRAEMKVAFENADAEIVAQMDTVKGYLLALCKKVNANSINTSAGTIIRSVKTRYWTGDWEEMHKFVKENNALDLLERRIAQKSMGEFLTNNPDKMPKGLNVDSQYDVVVRRSK